MNRKLILFLIICAISCKENGKQETSIDYARQDLWDEWRFKTEDGVSLFVREFGTGDTITVLHGGWGAEHSYLIDAFAPLANQYHFIFYDQRGSLRSKCADSLISVDKHIEDVERFRKASGQKKLLLIGHSMGGFLAMSYQKKYPENVKGLILVSSAPARGSVKQLTEDIQGPALARWERKEVADTLKAHGLDIKNWDTYKGKQSSTVHRITFAAINLHHVKNWRKLRGAFDWNEKASAIAATSGPMEWDFTHSLKDAGFPIYVIHGNDDYLPIDYQKQWVPSVPNAILKPVKDAGHACWIDQPEQFKRFLLEALGNR